MAKAIEASLTLLTARRKKHGRSLAGRGCVIFIATLPSDTMLCYMCIVFEMTQDVSVEKGRFQIQKKEERRPRSSHEDFLSTLKR